jgi:hypothetical protein
MLRRMNSRPTFVALVASLLLVAGGCGDDPETSSGQSSTSASPSAAASSAGEVIRFGRDGATIENESDVSKLEGAPEDFKTFIAGLIDDVEVDEDCEYDAQYAVDAIDPSGYASGGFAQCGGHYILWARVAGQWREVLAGQDHPPCDDLSRLGIPKEILVGDRIGTTCFDDGTRPVPYEP